MPYTRLHLCLVAEWLRLHPGLAAQLLSIQKSAVSYINVFVAAEEQPSSRRSIGLVLARPVPKRTGW